jgi:hypothetical protein
MKTSKFHLPWMPYVFLTAVFLGLIAWEIAKEIGRAILWILEQNSTFFIMPTLIVVWAYILNSPLFLFVGIFLFFLVATPIYLHEPSKGACGKNTA